MTVENNIEKIKSAAIKYRKKGEYEFQYVSGYSHADCLNCFGNMYLYANKRDMDVEEQGFITTKGRFVNRHIAMVIALRAGQIPSSYNWSDLYSEYIDWKV